MHVPPDFCSLFDTVLTCDHQSGIGCISWIILVINSSNWNCDQKTPKYGLSNSAPVCQTEQGFINISCSLLQLLTVALSWCKDKAEHTLQKDGARHKCTQHVLTPAPWVYHCKVNSLNHPCITLHVLSLESFYRHALSAIPRSGHEWSCCYN